MKKEIAIIIDLLATDARNVREYNSTEDKYVFAKVLLEDNEVPATAANIEALENLLESRGNRPAQASYFPEVKTTSNGVEFYFHGNIAAIDKIHADKDRKTTSGEQVYTATIKIVSGPDKENGYFSNFLASFRKSDGDYSRDIIESALAL